MLLIWAAGVKPRVVGGFVVVLHFIFMFENGVPQGIEHFNFQRFGIARSWAIVEALNRRCWHLHWVILRT